MGSAKCSSHLGSNGRGTALLSNDIKMAQILVVKLDGIYTSGCRLAGMKDICFKCWELQHDLIVIAQIAEWIY